MSDLLKFSIPGKPGYVKMVKLAIGSAAGVSNFNIEAIEDIEIAVGEACKIITCHGFDGFSDFYDVECSIDEDQIAITVTDACCAHSLEKFEKPCLDCPNEGNLGIYVIKSLMDDVEIVREEDKKNSIRMVKRKC